MKVTVCELRNEPGYLEQDWQELVDHVKSEASDLVLLPEMPFYPWIARWNQIDDEIWKASVEAHDRWISRLTELETALVISTRPIIRERKRFNEGFVWDRANGYQGVHRKYQLSRPRICQTKD
jgi:N-carbamoylputrescine amidase